MINKTRLIFVTITVLCLLPGQVFADGRVSFRFQGGWTYISGGDVNHGTQAYFDLREAQWGASEGGYRALHNSYEFSGDIIFGLMPRLGLSIGAGYLRISRASLTVLYIPGVIGPSAGLIAEPKLDAMPIRLGLDFTIPLNKHLNIHTEVGASYFLRARYSDEWRMLISSMDTVVGYRDIATRAERKKAPIGFHGGIGLEYMLSKETFLVFGAKGRYARFAGWHGSSVLESDFEAPFSEEGIMYYEVVPMLVGSPRLIMVQSDPPDGPDGEPRQAIVDFSGFSLQIGIQIRL